MHTDRCGNTHRQKCCAKGTWKKLKYNSLHIHIQRMWNLKCMIITAIIGSIGIVTRNLRKNLEAIPGRHSIDSLQSTAILGTSDIRRNYCSVKLEAWVVGITAGWREVPGRKGLWQETFLSCNNKLFTMCWHKNHKASFRGSTGTH